MSNTAPHVETYAPDLVTRVRDGDLAGPQKVALGVGALALIAGCIVGIASHSSAFYFSYLVAYLFGLSICLGGLFFVLLQHITRAGWSITIRRTAENLSACIWVFVPLFIPILIGFDELYGHWTHDTTDEVILGKRGYLNVPFFFVRFAIYFATWIGLAAYFRRKSLEQDESGDPAITLRLARLAAPAILVFALTVTFAAFDWIMSLDPHWFSTIFGVVFFIGGFMGFLAFFILLLRWMARRGYLGDAVNTEHYHDLGKLMFAFMVFWAYVSFSQFMLIWYANLPEETAFYAMRQEGGWHTAFTVLALGHFIAPFVLVMSRHVKRNTLTLTAAATWMVLMHWIDLQDQVVPNLAHAGHEAAGHGAPGGAAAGAAPAAADGATWLSHFTVYDPLVTLGVLGLLVGVALGYVRRTPLVPLRDPRVGEALAFENQ